MIDRGTELKNYRLKLGLKQKTVSNTFNFSRAYLYQIECGKRKCPKRLYNDLMNYYDEMNQTEGLEAMFDYIRIRLPTHDIERVINCILMMEFTEFYCKPTGLYGYMQMYEYDSIRVLESDKKDERGTLIELSGRGCRNYEYVLNELDQKWTDFFSRCLLIDGVVKRIDIAVDDYVEYFSLEEVVKKRKKNQVVTSFRKSRVIDASNDEDEESEGITVYFGTRNSLVYFCFYQKNYEISVREKVPLEEIEVKNRYEIRFQQEKAHLFIEHYLDDTWLLRSARSVMSQQLTFLEKNRHGVEHEWPKWKKFIGATEYVDLSMKAEKPSFDRKIRWLKNYCSQSLEIVRIAGEQEGIDYFAELFRDVELNDRNKQVLAWQLLKNQELLSYEGQLISQETGEIIC